MAVAENPAPPATAAAQPGLLPALSTLMSRLCITGQSLSQMWLPQGEGLDAALVTAGPWCVTLI